MTHPATPNVTYAFGPVETLAGRYSRRTLTASHPEGGSCSWDCIWDTTGGVVGVRPTTKTRDVPLAVQRAARELAQSAGA